MARRAMACIGCWLALTLAAVAQEPALDENSSQPAAEQAARLPERVELAARAKSLQAEGKLSEAIEVFRQVLAIEREVFGEEHSEVAGTHGLIAGMQEAAEDFPAAEKSRQEALDLLTKLHGGDDWRVTDARLALEHVRLLAGLDRSDRNEFRRSEALNQRVLQLYMAGKSREALPLAEEAREIVEKVLGEGHLHYATSLNNLATLYMSMGDYAGAVPLCRQILEIQGTVLGKEHPEYATNLNNLAFLYDLMGDYGRAEPLYRQALGIGKKVIGEEHPHYATSLNNLATLYMSMGDYARAEPLYRQALKIRKRVLPEEHPEYASSLHNLAGLYDVMGDYERAEPLYGRAQEIWKVLGEERPDYALSLSNLAVLYESKGEYARAEILFRQALEIQTKVLGEEHPDYARSLNNLAALYMSMENFGQAEPLYRQALEIRKKVLGEGHPDYAISLHNLAGLYDSRGDNVAAEALYCQALEIEKKVLGEVHPDYVKCLYNLAFLYRSMGDGINSLAQLREATAAYEAARLRVAAESLERAAFGVDQSPYRLLAAVEAGHGDSIEAWHALEADLARGMLDEAASRAGLQLTDSEEQERLEQTAALEALQPLILRLVIQTDPAEEARTELAGLLEQRSAAAARLARLGAALSRRQVADLTEIQASLPTNGALVTWVDISTTDGSVQEHWGCVVRSTGEPAWVRLAGTGADGAWTDDDAGLPKRLRAALAQAETSEEVAELSRRLAAQRIDPLLPHLDGGERLYVAAVNEMAGVPVDVLTDRFTISYVPSGTQLVRAHARERPAGEATLLALGDPVFNHPGDEGETPAPTPLPPGGLLITHVIPEGNAANAQIAAGDVLLAYAGKELASVQQLGELVATHATDESVTIAVWRDGEDAPIERTLAPGKLGVALAPDPAPVVIARRREIDLLLASVTRGKHWEEIPGTRAEIAGIAELFPTDQVTLLADSDASEQQLADLRASGDLAQYRYLHMATHGQVNRASAFESALILAQDNLSTVEDVAAGSEFFDGRLTANEILEHWNLNAELVTLSSCESGLGREGGGEGFLGFAQALLLAGSRSVCLSLWEVDDTATALLMDRFYQNLLGKRPGHAEPLPKAEALADAKRWLRSLTISQAAELAAELSGGVARGAGQKTTIVDLVPPAAPDPDAHPYEHPYFWAAFVLIGDPE